MAIRSVPPTTGTSMKRMIERLEGALEHQVAGKEHSGSDTIMVVELRPVNETRRSQDSGQSHE